MLDYMRRHSQSSLIYVFFGIIIVVFVFFFGPQSRGCRASRTEEVASVGEHYISSRQIEQLFLRISNFESRTPDEQRLDPGIRRRLLAEDLVLVHLLASYARQAGLAVSDQQLSAYVRDPSRNPDFNEYRGREGGFSIEQFELRVPGAFGLSVPEYEAFKESELLAVQYLDLLGASLAVSRSEVEAVHKLRNTRYQLEYLPFDPARLAPLFTVTDDEVANLLEGSPERVQAYFESHLDAYRQPRQLRVSRILIQPGNLEDPESQAQARQQFETALARVQEDPTSFADVAREFSQSVEAVAGGDMGLKSAADYEAYPFLAGRLDQLATGSIETFESDLSLVIFRIDEDVPGTTPTLEEVREQVAREILEAERTGEPARELAEYFLAQAQTGLTLADIVQDYSESHPLSAPPGEGEGDEPTQADPPTVESLLTVQQTELFALDTPGLDLSMFGPQYANQPRLPGDPSDIPGMARLPRLARQLAQLTTEGAVAPEVYSDGQTFYVARLIQYEAPPETIDDAAFTEIRDELHRDKVRTLLGSWEARLLFHQAAPLTPFLDEVLDRAIERGIVKFNEAYFVVEAPAEPAS